MEQEQVEQQYQIVQQQKWQMEQQKSRWSRSRRRSSRRRADGAGADGAGAVGADEATLVADEAEVSDITAADGGVVSDSAKAAEAAAEAADGAAVSDSAEAAYRAALVFADGLGSKLMELKMIIMDGSNKPRQKEVVTLVKGMLLVAASPPVWQATGAQGTSKEAMRMKLRYKLRKYMRAHHAYYPLRMA